MKIVRIETFATVDVGFVKITTDSGAEGWGSYLLIILTFQPSFCIGR